MGSSLYIDELTPSVNTDELGSSLFTEEFGPSLFTDDFELVSSLYPGDTQIESSLYEGARGSSLGPSVTDPGLFSSLPPDQTMLDSSLSRGWEVSMIVSTPVMEDVMSMSDMPEEGIMSTIPHDSELFFTAHFNDYSTNAA